MNQATAKKINRRELRNPKTATVDFYINTSRFRIKRATPHAEKKRAVSNNSARRDADMSFF